MRQNSRLLYLILPIQSALYLLIFLLGFIQYDSPLDSKFGMITILAGIRPDTLPLLKGACISGELKKPLPLAILTEGIPAIEYKGKSKPQVEFELDVLGTANRNKYLPHPWFDKPTSRTLLGIKDAVVRRMGGRSGASVRQSTVEMADLRGRSTAYDRL